MISFFRALVLFFAFSSIANAADSWQEKVTELYLLNHPPTWQESITGLFAANQRPVWQETTRALYIANQDLGWLGHYKVYEQ
ncbi:MAG: hypothetical protein EP297_07500 [Gammaproteobacteria bacterium]|nr:MAG: hypothetical protein EP297_07500 [Gammaproteobacteria bacterium]